MGIQIKLSEYFHPNIYPFSQNVIQNQTKQRKNTSTPLTPKNSLNNCLLYFCFRTC